MKTAFTRIRLLSCLGALSALVWAGTFATFSDSGSATSTFSSGTVDLVVGGDTSDAYSFAALTTSGMKPGDVKYASLSVANTGTLGFGWTMSSAAQNASGNTVNLHDALTLEVKVLGSGVTCGAAGFGDASNVTVVAAGTMSSRPATTSRSLAASASETLCFKVELPSSTGNDYQGGSSTATFSFEATQA